VTWNKIGRALLPLPAMAMAMAPQLATAQATPAAERDSVVGPAFYVSDLARSLKFYREGLGMAVTMQFGADGAALDPKERARAGRLAEGHPNTVLSFGDDPMAPVIMLLRDGAPTGPRKIEHAHGYARLAVRIADLPAVSARLKAAGFEPSAIRGAHGTHQVMFVKDPDGYTVELVERNR
jgi:catechol 2,3-dioxygenase-like lactoylglutathione lyase family enzyme